MVCPDSFLQTISKGCSNEIKNTVYDERSVASKFKLARACAQRCDTVFFSLNSR